MTFLLSSSAGFTLSRLWFAVENSAHCDFVKLRNAIGSHMQDLKDVTRETHYELYLATWSQGLCLTFLLLFFQFTCLKAIQTSESWVSFISWVWEAEEHARPLAHASSEGRDPGDPLWKIQSPVHPEDDPLTSLHVPPFSLRVSSRIWTLFSHMIAGVMFDFPSSFFFSLHV